MRRVTLQINDTDFATLKEHVPHGFRTVLMAALLRLVLAAVKEHGQAVTGAIIAGRFKLVENAETTNGR